MQRSYAEIAKLGLPIGWVGAEGAEKSDFGNPDTYAEDERSRRRRRYDTGTRNPDLRRVPDTPNGWVLKALGLLITGLAISQGAPFWFDLLNKFIVIRSTVKPKEKSQEQPSKDRPAPETELEEDDTNKN